MLRICATFVLLCLPLAGIADPQGAVQVIDADTWDVGGQRVRLFGIDAPEADQTCEDAQGAVWACGDWATNETRRRFEGRNATCTAITTDRYDRIVARCLIDGIDAGRVLVSDGVAFAYRRYSLDYDLNEKSASVGQRGLHGSKLISPAEFRARRSETVAAPDPGCAIKGNLSSKGQRIYHMPGQEHYGRTRINRSKGERWFCSEAEAQLAGWRRARR